MKPSNIGNLDLTERGNFPGHVHFQVGVSWNGVYDLSGMALKFYSTVEDGQIVSRKDLTPDAAADFIAERARGGHLPPLCGLGFVILSRGEKGIINVVRWGLEGKPHLPRNDVIEYTSRNGRVNQFRNLTLEEGAYCGYELEITGHEARAWRAYLDSPRDENDKRVYLNDHFRGKKIR